MLKKINFLTLVLFFTYLPSQGQISGNQAYNNGTDNYTRTANRNSVILVNDSSILISANILLNTPADVYMVTLALSQEGKTLKECSDSINMKVESFKSAIKKIGVTEKDIYVDFISQAKIYDYNISGRTAEQFQNGFEIKKNIIISLSALADFDRLMIIASQHDIYDIVKVDYIISDIGKIYSQLMAAASEIINQKKATYQQVATFQLLPTSKVYSENFYSVDPKNQYQSYKAFESSDVYGNADANLVKKVQRMSETFYYDGISPSGFDSVINATSPVVGVQFVLELNIKFGIQKMK